MAPIRPVDPAEIRALWRSVVRRVDGWTLDSFNAGRGGNSR